MKRVLIGIASLLVAFVVVVIVALRASLPVLEGRRALAGLTAPVAIVRDNLGIPTVRGRTRLDVARATGYLHAQDRFFQMDLLRRDAAGELAALVGAKALERDKQRRLHRLRAVAARAVDQASEQERALLNNYSEGVNAGLSALAVRPFEYLLLRATPEPWRPDDTMLAIFAMYFQLHDEDGILEAQLGALRDVLPGPVFEFLAPAGTEWDAPLIGPAFPRVPVPEPESCDLREVGPAPRSSSPNSVLLGTRIRNSS
jgi:penicillin amidase